MKNLFLIITVALFPICLPYDPPVIEEVRPQRVSRRVQATLPSPVATEYVPQSEIEKKICELWKDRCEDALKVARCESGLKPNAIGDGALAYMKDGVEYGKSYGIFQIRHLPGRPDPEYLLDPVKNIQYAYNNIFKPQGGFQAWTCKKVLSQNL